MDAAGNVAVARRRVHVVNPCGGEDENEFPCLTLDATGAVCSAGGLCSSVTFEEPAAQVVRSVPSLTLLGSSEVSERWPLLLASPSELSASPSELLASPSELVASPSELSVSPSSSLLCPLCRCRCSRAPRTRRATSPRRCPCCATAARPLQVGASHQESPIELQGPSLKSC
jgi:hypothetical protein